MTEPHQLPDPAATYRPAPAPAPAPRASSDGVVALVLAILAWVVCPIVLAVVALVFADRARAEIAGSGGWVTGDGMVTAAKVVAWVNIAVFLAIGLMVAAGLVWAAVMVNVTAS